MNVRQKAKHALQQVLRAGDFLPSERLVIMAIGHLDGKATY